MSEAAPFRRAPIDLEVGQRVVVNGDIFVVHCWRSGLYAPPECHLTPLVSFLQPVSEYDEVDEADEPFDPPHDAAVAPTFTYPDRSDW